MTARQCVLCHEVDMRLLSSCVIENNKFVPQKTKEQVLKEIESEGLTIEILKALEEKSLSENKEH